MYYTFASKRSRVALSLAIVAILLSTTLVVIEHPWSTEPSGTATFGPKIVLTLVNGSLFSSSANVTESIQLMGVNPYYLGRDASPGSYNVTGAIGSPYVEVYNGSFFPKTENMNRSVLLNGSFLQVLTGWKSYFNSSGEANQSVSLETEASLSVLVNGNLTVYTYYNNIPFNPLKMNLERYNQVNVPGNWFRNTSVNPSSYSSINLIHAEFNVTPSFDLSSPTFSTQLNNSSSNTPAASPYSPDRIIGICDPGTYYIANKTTIRYGPDALNTVHINATYNGSVSLNQLLISQSIANSTVELSMNSAETTLSSGGTYTSQMSTSPSWSGTGKFTDHGNTALWQAYPNNSYFPNGTRAGVNNTTAIIYIANATYTVTHYNIWYIWGNEYDRYQRYLGNATSMVVTAINSTNGNYLLKAYFEPIWFYYIYQNLSSGSNKVSLGTLAGGQEIQGGQIWGYSTGYTNAASVYKTAAGAATVFQTSIELGFAIAEVLASVDVMDTDIPAVVADGIKAITTTIGFVKSVLADFASISFSTTSKFGSDLYGIRSSPSLNAYAYTLIDYESPNPLSFTANGTTYEFTAPSNFILAS